MWLDILTGYGIFILEILTILLVITAIAAFIISAHRTKEAAQGELVITNLSEELEDRVKYLRDFHLSDEELKQQKKVEKKAEKQKTKDLKAKLKKGEPLEKSKPSVYVLDFKGDISASQTTALREEVSAILNVTKPDDEVLLRLESPGGVVHGYGLAASQLARLKQKGIKLTIAIDKVAASGGYMMACVADKIIAAPFAIIGSIGVVAQVPNIHRLLKKHDVDVDVMTAGEFKRTVTMLGENTEKGKQKFQQELEETHGLFKQFVQQNRPHLDVNKVATGEHWFGTQALELQLIDGISTSDDLLLDMMKDKLVIGVNYKIKTPFLKKLGQQVEESVDALIQSYMNKTSQDFIH
ncbi:protease SohB [Rodentibacter pneumotropicus]|uniref:Protease SohB n=1 Tax=Rodentibacter pneumotropicus TaxID=758 RepID=A0A4S2QAE6_9PAST|nr:protease SohB [Rodentibacter pneumotropicus]THA00924.1 protease SohB [Rodentibacter pneumotropicus]THA02142.1 protease SohB [Rodentibacter pneumotropicus]THA09734.1 protease SohB [Rodentibacter pneumotropicus]THA13274.1 protease SohB [Rodentibacter pneumotropicus]